MANFYIYFATNLNLIFVAAKLFNFIEWSWLWVMTPMIIMTVLSLVASYYQAAKAKKFRGKINENLSSFRAIIEQARVKRGH